MKIFFYSIYVLIHREWTRFFRQKSRVLSSVLTPLIFWALMGTGFGKSLNMPFSSSGYLEYFFPGILMMTLLFSVIFSMISLIEDRNEGFLQSVMVSPVSYGSIVFGKIIGAATLSVAQCLILLPFSRFAGISIGWGAALQLAGLFFCVALLLCSLSFLCAWAINSSQGFHAVMNVLLLPMWLLSGAMFPMSGSATWIQWVMMINPLTYGIDAVQKILYVGRIPFPIIEGKGVWSDVLVILLFSICFIILSLNSVKKSYR